MADKTYGTRNGKPFTEADAARVADQAESGDVRAVGRPRLGGRGRGKSPQLAFRVSGDLADLLDDAVHREGVSRSEIGRRALRAYLSQGRTTAGA